MNNIWFTSDTHFSHRNVLKHCKGRLKAFGIDETLDDREKVILNDEAIIKRWNSKVKKKDIVYIIGDFSFASVEQTKKILGKLNGIKFLITGNHDKSSEHLRGYFENISQIKDINFKQRNFDFLEEDFSIVCCHYPMVTWNRKHYGSVNVHGHCHGNIDDFNEASDDLRVDVGIDGKLANYDLIDLETLYHYFKGKANGKLFSEYVLEKRKDNSIVI